MPYSVRDFVLLSSLSLSLSLFFIVAMAIYRLGARQWQSNDRRGVASNGFWFLFLVSCFEAIPVKPSYQSRNCLKNSSPVSFSIQLVNWCVERKKKKRTREFRFQKKGNSSSSSSSSIWKITIRGRGRVSRLVTRRLNSKGDVYGPSFI